MNKQIERGWGADSPPEGVLVQDLEGPEPELAAVTVRTPRGKGPKRCRMPWGNGIVQVEESNKMK